MTPFRPCPARYADGMTSEQQPIPTAEAAAPPPDLPEVAPPGPPANVPGRCCGCAPTDACWVTQLLGGTGDRLAFLVLVALTVPRRAGPGSSAAATEGSRFALTLVFAVRAAATALFGVALLGPLHRLLTGRLDRRWTLIGADVLRAVLVAVAPWWFVWAHGDGATYALLATVFAAGAAERVWSRWPRGSPCRACCRWPTVPRCPPTGSRGLAAQRLSAANLDTLRTLDLRTGWATLPLAAIALIGLTLVNNLAAALGSHWLRGHQVTVATLGAAGLFVAASAALLYLQDLPRRAAAGAPVSPLHGLRAPTDATPGPAFGKGRTGSAPYFTFAVAAAYASMAGVAALALLTAAEHSAGPIGDGLLVLAATGLPWLGLGCIRVTLPALSRRRLLAIALRCSAPR